MVARWLTLMAFLLASGAAPLAHASPTVAMNGHLPSAADSASMAALGVRAVRMDFNWFQFEPTRDGWTWGHLDAAVAGARANGLAIYATVAYTPAWASTLPTCTLSAADESQRCENKLPASDADWSAAVAAVVAHFAGQIECWGIWNEPNLRGFFDGSEDDFVNHIFLPAATAIRANDPAGLICGPELAGLTASSNWNGKNGTCAFGSCIRNGWELDLAQLLDRVGTQIDVVTQHTYQSDAPGVMSALLDGSSILGVVQHDAIRNVVRAHGGAAKPFWLTETGWEHGPQGTMPEADVATRIVDLFAKQEEVCAGTLAASSNDPWPEWTRTYYFHFPFDPGSGWGLLDSAGAPLPAYTALQAWTAGRTTTACGAAATPADAGLPPSGPDAAQPLPGPDAAQPPQGSDAGAAAAPDAATLARDASPAPAPDAASSSSWPDAAVHRDDAGAGPDVVGAGCGCASGPGDPALLFAIAAAATHLCHRRRPRPAP
jgi:MYXO-CTERM domain-containing protein